jgi:hypothetical protein
MEYYQNGTKEIDGSDRVFDIWSSWMFTSGKEKGILLHDHVWSAIASSDPSLITVDKDFSAFDSHQMEANSRLPMREAFAIVFGQWIDSFGPWENVLAMVTKLLGKGRAFNRYYKSKGVKNGKTEETFIYNGLGSGEAITLNANNIVNAGLQRDMYNSVVNHEVIFKGHGVNKRVPFEQLFKLMRIQIMGDDEQETWLDEGGNWSLGMHKHLVDTSVAVAKRNGHDLNASKTLTRKSAAEYLKKIFMFGHYIPLGLIQLIAKERGDFMVDPIELFRGYKGLINTASGRGFNHNGFALKLLHYTWAMRRGFRWFEKTESGFVYAPFALLWTPIMMGGIGAHWICPYGANIDASLAVIATWNRDYKVLVEQAAGKIKGIKSRIVNRIKDAIKSASDKRTKNRSTQFDQAFDEIKLSMPKSRIANAVRADNFLRYNNAPKLGGLFYLEYPKEMIAQMFTSTSKVNAIKLEDQLNVTRLIRVRNEKVSFEEEFPWVFAYNWYLDDIENHVDGRCPIVGLDENSKNLLVHMGINLSGINERFTPNTVFTILKRDRFWRRDVTEEALFKYLTQPSLLTNTQLIYPTLIAIGVREDLAGMIASKLVGSLDGMDIKMNVQHVSLNDGFLNTLDIRRERIEASVKCGELDDVMKNVLISIGYMNYIINAYMGIYRKIHITENIDSTVTFGKKILKNSEDEMFDRAESTARFRWATEKQKLYGMDSEGRFVPREEIM